MSRKTLDALLRQYPGVQLATLVDSPPEGEEWIHEIKFDGYRLLGFVSGGDVCLRTRNGLDWTAKFPAIVEALGRLKAKDAVLDMEAVVLDDQGKSGFQALQAALGDGGHRERIIAFVFDLLRLDGTDLTGLRLTERKDKLQAFLTESKAGTALRFSAHTESNGAEMLAKSCALGLEGIVSKLSSAPYRVGCEKSWLKAKCTHRQEFIIVGHRDARTGDRALGALYLGYYKSGTMAYAGKVGTGFTMKSARALAARLEKFSVDKPVLGRAAMTGTPAGEWNAIHWTRPELLGEVEFTEWTGDGHIRHPSFQGLREDKKASGVKREEPVKKDAAGPVKAPSKGSALVLKDVRITHPDRVISETGHVTKGELAEYHAAVALFMLAHIGGHPLSLLRCPSGIDGTCFFQRNPGTGLGPDVHPFQFRHKGKTYEYLYIDDEKGLLEIIQMGAIELHPWGAPGGAIDFPDRLIFDLDPAPDVPFEAVKLAALDLRRRLKDYGLESLVKCSGGKGLHVIVPLAGKDKWPAVKSFAGKLAEEMVAEVPDAYVATMTKSKRTGKIFIDYLRNDYTATAIADYGVRARPGAPVAVPLEWKELRNVKSASQFTMKDVLARLKGKKPPARPKGQRIPSDPRK